MLMNSWLTLVTNSLQKSNLRRPAKSSRKHSRRVVGIRPAAETLETRALLSAISVSQSTMPMVVDLTAEGTTDWVSWAVPEDQQPVRPGFSTTPYAQKDGGADIGTVIYDSTVDPISDQQGDGDIDLRYLAFSAASAPYNVTWTDGDSSALWTGGPLDTGRLFQPNEILPDGLAHPSSSQGSGLLQAFADGAGGQGPRLLFR